MEGRLPLPPMWLKDALLHNKGNFAASLAKDPSVACRQYSIPLDVLAMQYDYGVPLLRLLLGHGMKARPKGLEMIINHKSDAFRTRAARDILKAHVKACSAKERDDCLLFAISAESASPGLYQPRASRDEIHVARMLVRHGADPFVLRDAKTFPRLEPVIQSFVQELCRYKTYLHTQRHALYALIGLRRFRRAPGTLIDCVPLDVVREIARVAWRL